MGVTLHRLHPILFSVLLCSCAAPYLTAQRGHVTPRGAFRAQLAAGGGVATSAIRVVHDAREFAKSVVAVDCSAPGGKCFRRADFRPLVDGGVNLALFGPASFDMGGSIRYGYADHLDVGAALLGSGYRLDAGWQFLDVQQWSSALYLGWNHHRPPLGDYLEKLQLDGFSRDDMDVFISASRPLGAFFELYGSGRYMLSRWGADLTPGLPIIDEQYSITQYIPDTDRSGLIHQFGGAIGLTAGYKYLHVGAELNVVGYTAGAQLLGEQKRFTGVTVYPAIYVFGPY